MDRFFMSCGRLTKAAGIAGAIALKLRAQPAIIALGGIFHF